MFLSQMQRKVGEITSQGTKLYFVTRRDLKIQTLKCYWKKTTYIIAHTILQANNFYYDSVFDNFQEQMTFLEAEGARNVIEACGRAAYVKKCIFTSSLLASLWKGDNVDRVIDETCWSDEEFCLENKVFNLCHRTINERGGEKIKIKISCPTIVHLRRLIINQIIRFRYQNHVIVTLYFSLSKQKPKEKRFYISIYLIEIIFILKQSSPHINFSLRLGWWRL